MLKKMTVLRYSMMRNQAQVEKKMETEKETNLKMITMRVSLTQELY